MNKQLLELVTLAPDGIREYLQTTFWILVFLTIVWGILKLIFNKEFKKLYKVLRVGAQKAGTVGKSLVQGAAKELELPEPYPRTARFFAIIFMANSYLMAFFFAAFFLVTAVVLAFSTSAGFWGRNIGLLFSFICGYFAWFSFAQAERDRVALFCSRNDDNDG